MDENTVIKANTIYVSSNNEDQRNTSSFTFYPNRGFLAWTLPASLMPEIYPGLTRTEYWITGIFGAGTSSFCSDIKVWA